MSTRLQIFVLLFLTIFSLGWLEADVVDVKKLTLGEYFAQVEAEVATLLKSGVSELQDGLSTCYDKDQQQQLNIFNGSLQISELLHFYYNQTFPEKSISQERIANLLQSTGEIIKACPLVNRSNSVQIPSSSTKLGYTVLSDLSETQVEKLSSGFQVSPRQGRQFRPWQSGCSALDIGILPAEFDWRSKGVVTPVRSQGRCGSCWAFAALGALESAILIHRKELNYTAATLDLSEQHLLDCSGRHCNGGDDDTAYSFIKNYGVTEEAHMPYLGRRNFASTCHANSGHLRRPTNARPLHKIAGHCSHQGWGGLSDRRIQQALLKFGPLFIGMRSNGRLRNYLGGTIVGQINQRNPFYNPFVSLCPPGGLPNHAALLVGYTPDAWIIRNSWTESWGDRGYLYLARGNRNLCSVNSWIAWPLLR